MSTMKCVKCNRNFKVNRSSQSHLVHCPYCKAENHMFWTAGDITKGIMKLLFRI